MADSSTVTKRVGWGERIVNSIKGVFTGILLFFASFGVLYWNEGKTDMSEVAGETKILSAENMDASLDGQGVSITGAFYSDERLGDTYLQPGEYLALQRKVEIYAWKEQSTTVTKDNLGGSQTQETTYTYSKEWTTNPADSSQFHDQSGDYENYPLEMKGEQLTVSEAKLGIYTLDMKNLDLPASKAVVLNDQNAIEQGAFVREGNTYLYDVWNSVAQPEIGDLRISYLAVFPIQTATVFGELQADGSRIVPYYDKDGNELYEVRSGGRNAALGEMHSEHSTSVWIFRLIGFLMMWSGLSMLLGPISAILGVVPFLGSLSQTLIKAVMFVIALVLSFVTIIISMILHNIFALLITVALIIGGVVWYLKQKEKEVEEKGIAPREKVEL